MTEAIQIPQTTFVEWRSLIAKKSGCDEQAVDDVLERFAIEVDSIAPRRKTILLRSVRLSGTKSGLKDQHQADIPDQAFDYTWKDLDRGLWIVTSDKNSKGKSSILNAFKAAIKGKFPGAIKPDVWNWLSLLQVEFSIDGALHRVTMEKNNSKNEGAIEFAASLERQEEDKWLVLYKKLKPDEFEDVMSDFFMQELGFEKFRAFQRKTESFNHHGWPSMGSALFLIGSSDALFGDETTGREGSACLGRWLSVHGFMSHGADALGETSARPRHATALASMAPDLEEPTGAAAIAAGYQTIFDICAERLRRSHAATVAGGNPSGFRVFRAAPSHLSLDLPIVATAEMTGEQYLQMTLDNMNGPPVVPGADPLAVAWEVVLKATRTCLDARVIRHDLGDVRVFEFSSRESLESGGRLLVSLDAFNLATAQALDLNDNDTLILRSDKIGDSTALTLAPRLQSKLLLLERAPREVSL